MLSSPRACEWLRSPSTAAAVLPAPWAIATEPVPFASQVAVPAAWRTAPLAATQTFVSADAAGADSMTATSPTPTARPSARRIVVSGVRPCAHVRTFCIGCSSGLRANAIAFDPAVWFRRRVCDRATAAATDRSRKLADCRPELAERGRRAGRAEHEQQTDREERAGRADDADERRRHEARERDAAHPDEADDREQSREQVWSADA